MGSEGLTRVVHCKREKFDVYIGRPSIFGNPFKLTPGESREAVIAKYREWVLGQPKIMAQINTLRGKTLGCWCKPRSCHGDVLAELADATAERHPESAEGERPINA